MTIENEINNYLKKVLDNNIIQNISWEYNHEEKKVIFFFPHDYLKEYFYINFFNNIQKYLNKKYKILTIDFKIYNKYNLEKTYLNFKSNKNYNFENFFYGKNNEICIKTITNIIKEDIKDYNPILIYGNKGCGKSHLLTACLNLYISLFPNKKIFLCDLKKINYRNIYSLKKFEKQFDIFFIDHFEEIKNSFKIQEYFQHLINYYYNKNKIIFIVIEKQYLKYGNINDQLKSNILGGLILKLNDPDIKTKSKFIEYYIKKYNIKITNSQKVEISLNLKNIDEIKRLLLNLMTEKDLNNVDLNITKKIEKKIKNRVKISPDQIIKIVADHFKISHKSLISRINKKDISLARQISIYLIREILGLSSTQLGEIFGRDHSTILYSIKKINKYKELDIDFYNLLNNLKKKCQF